MIFTNSKDLPKNFFSIYAYILIYAGKSKAKKFVENVSNFDYVKTKLLFKYKNCDVYRHDNHFIYSTSLECRNKKNIPFVFGYCATIHDLLKEIDKKV